MDTQLELFPLSAVTGTGRPLPWPADEQPECATQDETLPADEHEDAA